MSSRYGSLGSSHTGYVPGIEWESGDERLIEPGTGWGGQRGARVREDAFGRLYRHSGDRLEPVDPADPSGIVGRSGTAGYRGGRPAAFGAEDRLRFKAGSVEYDGPQVGGILLGLAGLAVLLKLSSVIR